MHHSLNQEYCKYALNFDDFKFPDYTWDLHYFHVLRKKHDPVQNGSLNNTKTYFMLTISYNLNYF